MKTKYKNILKTLFSIFLTFIVFSCGYNEDVIEELAINREFAPLSLKAIVRNQTIVELSWTANDNSYNFV